MLHGVLRCGADFFPLLPYLDEALDVTFLDQRGHGSSERADSYRVADYLADAVDVVGALGAEDLIVFGHSLGGMVAAGVAETVSVAGVILEDPPFETMGSRIAGSVWHQVFMGFRDAVGAGCDAEGLFERLRGIPIVGADGTVSALWQLRDEASLRWSAKCLFHLDPKVLDPLLDGEWLNGFPWQGIFTRSRCPVLLLQGDVRFGGALTGADADAAGAGCGRVSRGFFEGNGHQLHASAPERIAHLVNRFVACV